MVKLRAAGEDRGEDAEETDHLRGDQGGATSQHRLAELTDVLVHTLEVPIHLLKSPIHLLKSPIHALETAIHAVEASTHRTGQVVEPFIGPPLACHRRTRIVRTVALSHALP